MRLEGGGSAYPLLENPIIDNVDDSVGNEIENINFKYFCYRASFMVKKPFTSPDTDTSCYVDR